MIMPNEREYIFVDDYLGDPVGQYNPTIIKQPRPDTIYTDNEYLGEKEISGLDSAEDELIIGGGGNTGVTIEKPLIETFLPDPGDAPVGDGLGVANTAKNTFFQKMQTFATVNKWYILIFLGVLVAVYITNKRK